MKAAVQKAQAQFKRYLGEGGIFLLCTILVVKILFDAAFSTMVWMKQDLMDSNMRIYVTETNRLIQHMATQLSDENRLITDARAEIQGFKAQAIDNQQTALSKMDESIRGITELLGDLRNFVNTRGYVPFTAAAMDEWVRQANERLRITGLRFQLPARPPNESPVLNKDLRGLMKEHGQTR